MKIIVCVKQVPIVSELKFDYEKKRLIREGVQNDINPFDRRAITFASDLKRRFGGEIVVITMGPPQAREALVEALAIGGDRALHLLDIGFAGADTLATSRALSLAILKEAPFDLVLCGKYSTDAETGHIGAEVAEFLNIPHVTAATKIEAQQAHREVDVVAETDYGSRQVRAPTPLLLTASEKLIKPAVPTPEELDKARSKPYRVVTAKELSSDTSIFGAEGSPTWVTEIRSVTTKRRCELIESPSLDGKVDQFVSKILASQAPEVGMGMGKDTAVMAPKNRATGNDRSVWVITELFKGRIRNVTYELLRWGFEVAKSLESELSAVIFGDSSGMHAADLIAHGADKVYVLSNESLAAYSSEAYTAALSEIIHEFSPHVIIAPATYLGRDFMPRVAARLKLGMTSDCVGLEVSEKGELLQLKPAFGGNIAAPILSKTIPQLATVRAGLIEPLKPNPARKGTVVNLHPTPVKSVIGLIEETYEADQYALRLDDAVLVVTVGAGVGSPNRICMVKEFAEALDAPLAATRKVVDLGWLPRQLQIGLTGRSLASKLYIGVGVRGAFNHMVGLGRVRTIIGINNDPNAPIFTNCDYGMVADYAEVIPASTRKILERRRHVTDSDRQTTSFTT